VCSVDCVSALYRRSLVNLLKSYLTFELVLDGSAFSQLKPYREAYTIKCSMVINWRYLYRCRGSRHPWRAV